MVANTDGLAAEQMLFDALDALKRGDVKPWVEMFHEDGIMEFPYAPEGYPKLLDGKAAIAAYMQSYPEHVSIQQVIKRAIHHCADAMVAEFSCEATAVASGNPYRMDYVAIVSIADGKVKIYRDYWNPLVAIVAMGGAEALLNFGAETRGQ